MGWSKSAGMLPDFAEVKARLLRLVSMDYRRQINEDNLIGQISAMPYFEGGRFSNGDVEGFIEVSPAEMRMIPYEIERSEILQEGAFAFVKSLRSAAQIHRAASIGAFAPEAGETHDLRATLFPAVCVLLRQDKAGLDCCRTDRGQLVDVIDSTSHYGGPSPSIAYQHRSA